MSASNAPPWKIAAAFGLESLAKDAFAVIRTTAAWTIPANQALNLEPGADYSPDTERVSCCWLRNVEKMPGAFPTHRHSALATTQGNPALLNFQHPFHDGR
jgi:isoleucyl-tRNA synthetase